MASPAPNSISLIVPVYRGELCLPALLEELEPLANGSVTPGGNRFWISEVLLVHDCGPDASDRTIEQLAAQFPFVRPVWLSRNYGQHAATLAGMASATGEWVATVDEDGQQDPVDIGRMLDMALSQELQLVYAQPTHPPPHGWLRNLLSRTAKQIAIRLLGNTGIGRFNSFRLVDGEIARSLAAYCGQGVFLDVGLSWITERVGHCPLLLRAERGRASGYSYLALLSHFWHMVLATGTRPLRLITVTGFSSVILAMAISAVAAYAKLVNSVPVQGWTSLVIVVSFFSGCILTALGVIAEYLAVTMGILMGKPLYMVGSKPTRSAARR